jgi:type IV secretion system protein VirB8
MNAMEQALPITRGEAETAYYAGVVAFQAQQARSWKRSSRRAWTAASGMFALNIVLAGALFEMMPLKQVVPVFAYLDEAGLLDTTTAISDLPPSTRVAGIESLLWQYLRHREHYAPSEAGQSYEVVSAMSDDTVRRQYQKWANPRDNKAAPAAVLGDHGFIRIDRISGAWVSHTPDYSSGVYEIRYCRTVARDNEEPVQQRMIETIGYVTVRAVPLWERVTFNHAGVIVTEYPGPETEGSPGAPHPCAG